MSEGFDPEAYIAELENKPGFTEFMSSLRQVESQHGLKVVNMMLRELGFGEDNTFKLDTDFVDAKRRVDAYIADNFPDQTDSNGGEGSDDARSDSSGADSTNALGSTNATGVGDGKIYFVGTYKSSNDIFYDEAATDEAIAIITSCCKEINELLTEVSKVDKYFDGIGAPYDKLIPQNRFANIYRGLSNTVGGAQRICMSRINEVVSAIVDYSDGDNELASRSKKTLDYWYDFEPKDNPSDGPSGGPSGGPSDIPTTAPVSPENDSDLGLEDPAIPDVNSIDMSVLPSSPSDNLSNHGNTGSTVLGGAGLGAASGILSSLRDEDLSEKSPLTSDLGTSLFGSSDSGFVVPSFSTTVGKTDGVKSSGIVGITGTAGAVVAAVAALGGKVYYDKKKESDEKDEEEPELSQGIDDEVENLDLHEIKTNADGIDFHVDGVKFKENLFNFVGGEKS